MGNTDAIRLLDEAYGRPDPEARTLARSAPISKLAGANFLHCCFAAAGADIQSDSPAIMAALWRLTDCYLTNDNKWGVTKELLRLPADGGVALTTTKSYALPTFFGCWYDPVRFPRHPKNANPAAEIETNLSCVYLTHVLDRLNAEVFSQGGRLHQVTTANIRARIAAVRQAPLK
jgi:hypothetical protein